jgi:hypothetical protein
MELQQQGPSWVAAAGPQQGSAGVPGCSMAVAAAGPGTQVRPSDCEWPKLLPASGGRGALASWVMRMKLFWSRVWLRIVGRFWVRDERERDSQTLERRSFDFCFAVLQHCIGPRFYF